MNNSLLLGANGIDGTTFSDMGLIIVETDELNRPALKESELTFYEGEGYRLTKQESYQLSIKLLVKGGNYQAFKSSLKRLYLFFLQPGLRDFTAGQDQVGQFFVHEGFTVSDVMVAEGQVTGLIDLNVTLFPLLAGGPTNLTATIENTGNQLQWQDNSNNETGFEIWRSENGTDGWQLIHSSNQNEIEFIDEP